MDAEGRESVNRDFCGPMPLAACLALCGAAGAGCAAVALSDEHCAVYHDGRGFWVGGGAVAAPSVCRVDCHSRGPAAEREL